MQGPGHLAQRRPTLAYSNPATALIHDVQQKLGITVDETMKLSGEVYDLEWEVSEGMKSSKTAQYVRFRDPSRKALFSTNTHQSPSSSEMVSAR